MRSPIAADKSPKSVGTGVDRWQVSPSNGFGPRWRADGRELYYVRGTNVVMAVDVGTNGSEFHIGRESELFRVELRQSFDSYEPNADGQQFVVNLLSGKGSTPIVVVQNWMEGLAK
jgi:hypothetical protein